MSAIEPEPVSLPEAARERYLSYAMSVITSRALPDVRDGLKPVQRRILYTMFAELSLHPGGRYRKSAAVVGDVMGKYHPHGDQSIYDALVRMAQPFALLHTLVDPQGNFGSMDGDPPAAMRYTECRLTAFAEELLQELRKDTVDFRPTYDGQRDEPIVLPAQVPQLLVNGVEGIAVGLATRIPPHNLGEVIDGVIAIIDGTAHDTADLLQHIHGPDFPTGGRLLTGRDELLKLYEDGQGTVRVQGQWNVEQEGRRTQIVITSVPYAQNKAKLVERIGADVAERRLPQVTDVRDESTEDVRIVLEIKPGTAPETVMAYLFKRTPLEGTFGVQMNALVPSERADVAIPERLDLFRMLTYWIDFRRDTVRRRYEHDLRLLQQRIHLLEGFALVFLDLDEAIRLIRASENKRDAARRLMDRFPLDEIQTEAILDLQLYKLASLEIALILDELTAKRAEAAEISEILGSEVLLMGRVRAELLQIREVYAQPRRTEIGGEAPKLTFDESAYVVAETCFVVVTRDGWIKRQGSFTEVGRIRVREHDEVGWVLHADTTTTITFFFHDGTACTMRVGDIPSTSGHGIPLQRQFSLSDGARLAGVMLHHPSTWEGLPVDPQPVAEDPAPPHLIALTRFGRIVRLAVEAFAEPSNKGGRRFARVDEGDAVLTVEPSLGGEKVCLASRQANVLVFPVHEASVLKGAGKGTTAITLKETDEVVAACLSTQTDKGLRVVASHQRTVEVNEATCKIGARAARGSNLFRRETLDTWLREPVVRVPGPTVVLPEGGEA